MGYNIYATENANHSICTEGDYLYNFILGFKSDDEKIIKIYATSDNRYDLNCKLIFDDEISDEMIEGFINLIKTVTITIEPNNSVKYYDKIFKHWRSIRTIAIELNNKVYLLDNIADIEVNTTTEEEIGILMNIKKENR